MTMAVTLVFAIVISLLLFILLRWVKTPYYRTDKARMIAVLEMVLTGQATENDWQILMGVTIRHSETLEAIRLECLHIEEQYYIGQQKPPYLFSQDGLMGLKDILNRLHAIDE